MTWEWTTSLLGAQSAVDETDSLAIEERRGSSVVFPPGRAAERGRRLVCDEMTAQAHVK